MSETDAEDVFPPYAYVPGGPWPHPVSSPLGHSHGRNHPKVPPIEGDAWDKSPTFLNAVDLFNAGFYWEAHEAWEYLWHGHGRKGAEADMLKGLIKLAAAGVKAREGQSHGVSIHSRRASEIFRSLRAIQGRRVFGLDLEALADFAEGLADHPQIDPGPKTAAVLRVLPYRLEPTKGG